MAALRIVTLVVVTLAAYGGRAGIELAQHGVAAITRPWQQWDANWFTWIARVGYAPLSPVHTNGRVYDAIVWPPLFPGLIAAISKPTGLDQGVVALTISSIVLFAAVAGLFRVVQVDHGEGVALATEALVLVYPSSMFLGAGYTEGLLLGLGAWSFWAAMTGRWPLAGILAAAAVMTKFYAVILVAALVWEYMDQRGWSWRRVRGDVAWLAVPWAAVLAGWLLYVQLLVGDWTRVLTSQKYWDRHLAMPWVSVLDAAGTLSRFRFIGVVDLGALVLLAILTAYSYGRVRRSYNVFLALGVVACVTSSTLVSTGRYTTIMFPMFIAAALLLRSRPWLERGIAVISGALMLGLLTRFATGHWAG